MPDDAWRTEADDEWLTRRRSDVMGWLRRHFRLFGGVAGAVSHAETGPFGGAPRNPRPRPTENKGYAVVRYTTDRIAYTSTTIDPDECRRCGSPLVEKHEIDYVQGDVGTAVGVVRTCRRCQADSWLLHSRMPTVSRARAASRKVVL